VLLLGLQSTFREKVEWLEEAETLSLHLRANRETRSNEERAAWRRHNLQTLAESSALPLEEKLTILEDLEETTIAMGYQRDPVTGRLRKPKF
jgi:hypothetical protein